MGMIITDQFDTRSLSNDDPTKVLTRTQGAGTSNRIMTFSWFLRTPSVYSSWHAIPFSNANGDQFTISVGGLSVLIGGNLVINLFEPDVTQWNHFCVQIDTPQAVAIDRVKLFVNGVDRTDKSANSTFPTLNQDTGWNTDTVVENAAGRTGTETWIFDEMAKIDGMIIPPEVFSSAASVKPNDLAGLNFGAQGWWLRFETGSAATAGHDSSPNANDLANTNFINDDFSVTVP